MKNLIWLIVSGLSVGWLVGLSISPVLGSVLAPILAVAATAIAALSGVRTEKAQRSLVEDTRPLGAFLLALAIASTASMLMRTAAYGSAFFASTSSAPAAQLGLFADSTDETSICGVLLTNEFGAALAQIENQDIANGKTLEVLKMLANEGIDSEEFVRLICTD